MTIDEFISDITPSLWRKSIRVAESLRADWIDAEDVLHDMLIHAMRVYWKEHDTAENVAALAVHSAPLRFFADWKRYKKRILERDNCRQIPASRIVLMESTGKSMMESLEEICPLFKRDEPDEVCIPPEILECIRNASEKQREVIDLLKSGMTISEIDEACGWRRGTAGCRMRNFRKSILKSTGKDVRPNKSHSRPSYDSVVEAIAYLGGSATNLEITEWHEANGYEVLRGSLSARNSRVKSVLQNYRHKFLVTDGMWSVKPKRMRVG